ncbi:putative glycosyltransferase [Candidatus Nitrososphaera gargensis Ga9.2]|uniref:Putative glycosyltransferase n=1 Tax=Nitrososphaera gargensis (strain Ga9.2) TaxID=1237085 RepID=K0IH10_NITGG|nr:glycosyltransferase [Candidatus Nitrososphaera gargensis]AFU58123.1 putative glycosyltransferase [Candidatus Nitrososphaera gargensis Ga9.2]
MRVKVVHDDINAGGGSERLAIITIGLLAEMGFKVDLASFKKPDIKQLKRDFGDIVDSVDINPVHLDLFSMIGLTNAIDNPSRVSTESKKGSQDTYGNDSDYNLIINTHGDLLPYYNRSKASDGDKKRIITYCHFPIVPQLIQENHDKSYMRFIRKWVGTEGLEEEDLQQRMLENILKTYDSMMRNTTVITNSNFSKKAIEERYGSAVKPIVVYPPVDVEKFRNIALHSSKRENMILVISRFSPDKQLENVIEVCKILIKDLKVNARIVLVGNIGAGDEKYLEKLKQSIRDYDLESKIRVEVDASFDRLLELMQKSKVYLHPLAGEPFGISIVEAMSAGLIPVVPNEGGYTEFVPEYYQFRTHRQAADIIGKILIASDNDMQAERSQLSESVLKFSNESYKAGLRKVIESLLPSRASLTT